MRRLLLCVTLLLGPAAGAFELTPGKIAEFNVQLPPQLRDVAGEGRPSKVEQARVALALPPGFDPARPWPVLVISATSAPRHYASNIRLMKFYADAAAVAGWVLLAADPDRELTPEEDVNGLRLALIQAAFAGVETKVPGFMSWPVAYGGFSGGAKRSGWLAAVSAALGRRPIGVFQAGINYETVARCAAEQRVLDAEYRRMPVFLLAGTRDEIATLAEHRQLQRELKVAGFKNVRLEQFEGPHAVDPRPLTGALRWFRELAEKP